MDLEVVEFPLHHKLALPFRIGLLFILGTWLWSLCCHYIYYLSKQEMDFYNGRTSVRQNSSLPAALLVDARNDIDQTASKNTLIKRINYEAGYCFSTIISISWLLGFLLFIFNTRGDVKGLYTHPLYPTIWMITTVALVMIPFPWRFRPVQRSLQNCIIRVFFLFHANSYYPHKDFLLSEMFTSYAKMLGDFYVFGCVLKGHISKYTLRPDLKCDGTIFVPLLMTYPFIVATLQSLHYGIRHRKTVFKISLLNALKHALAFPLIYLSALIHAERSKLKLSSSHDYLFWTWNILALLNSVYTFCWDTYVDWGIKFPFEKTLPKRRLPFFAYFLAALINFILRITWSLKLYPRLYQYHDYEMGMFSFEMLEVLRRNLWLLFHLDATL
ncbi:Erd1 [Schizosaccharomyces cryophilus OY26]|uniref:Erd1 n=1 Tax=Schizosaccharomyces cryophilus (strain OY26 / ATCC MYA-4695 / CBS 11777 / NBRC 106824 / NRRL Y48691) TaxID=653667 RepID=S9W8I0_SCHCR|nr:Erd1 [Schizosaccharomyces cryophilus OY26]EPY54190.1 Erd1 [Schizosaccharomyces cryophilus OY26]